MPRLNLQLSPEQHAQRRLGIGASDAKIIMQGTPEEQLKLLKLKRGEIEPEDLSGILPVAMGVVTEELNRHWFEQVTGFRLELDGVGEICSRQASEDYPWMRATLDGWVTELNCPFEAKHVNAFSDMDRALAQYMPQLQHQMVVCETDKAVLSVFFGTLRHEWQVVGRDEEYCKQLIEREALFWHWVKSGETPIELLPIEAPVLPSQMRTVDMQGNNYWADNASAYLASEAAAKVHENAKKSIRDMIEADVGTAHGYGVVAKRAKNGAITIRKGEL
jgi:predicted phage-related endonuclease